MKVAIAGSRNATSYHLISDAVDDSGFEITEVITGDSQGIDTLAQDWADEHDIDVRIFVADHKKWGADAMIKRNRQMLAYADALIVIWDGEHRNTKYLIDAAKKKKIKMFVYNFKSFHNPNPKDVGYTDE